MVGSQVFPRSLMGGVLTPGCCVHVPSLRRRADRLPLAGYVWTSRLASADELRVEITDVRAGLDSIGIRLDSATDINQRAVARLGLQVGDRWLEELESQLALVDD